MPSRSLSLYDSPDSHQNRHLQLSNSFWRLSSRADHQIGEYTVAIEYEIWLQRK